MGMENNHTLSGEAEIDEVFVGRKNKNRHKDKKVEKCQRRSYKLLLKLFNIHGDTFLSVINEYVTKGNVIYTDGVGYSDINIDYEQREM